jgi:hypothetical protein
MWSAVAAFVDVAHASLMAAWVLGLPLLFWRRWPRLTRAYAVYALVFIAVNLSSRALLGECFLTTIARACWQAAARADGRAPVPQEWFTVRMAEAVFRLTPTHRGIKRASEALIFLTAIGVLASSLAMRRRRGPRRPDGPPTPTSAERPKTGERAARPQPVPYATSPMRMTTARVPKRPNVA